LEIDIVRKDGAIRYLQVFREEVFWDGKTQYQILYNDITERKQAEQLYHTLADNSPVGIYIIQSRKFVFTNIAFQQVGGFTADELLDIEPAILVHPEDRDGVRQSAVQMLKGERLQPYEFRFITKSGETKWGLERTTSITYHGNRAILGNFMDITERKQAEEEIRRSNDTQTAVNALLKIALDGLSLEETLKRSIDLVLSIPWLTFESRGSIFLVEDDPQVLVMKAQNGLAQQIQRACARVPFGRCLCGQAALKREIQFADSLSERHETSYDGINPHGHYCVPILSADKVLGVLNIYVKEGHHRDKREEVFLDAAADALAGVIERKQVEEALKASEEKYSTLIEESSDGIVILKDRLVVFANHMMCEMSGYSLDGILGKSFHELVPQEYREMLAERERRELAKEFVSGREELEIIAKDGKRILIESRLINIVYKGGPAGMVIIHDITERKQVEEKLKQAAQEWRTTFDSITDLISIHDNDNRIIRVNKAVADMLKTTPQELIGKFCHDVMRGDHECPANCPQLLALRTGKPSSLEIFNPNLGLHFQESASPLFNEKGEITGTVLVARDVSQQKRMEEQLILTDRLASIGELSSGIAHELNNPLTSVIGFSQLLMEGDVPENMKEDLSTVYSEAQRAAVIVKNLLTFARKHAPFKQLTQVNAVIEDVLRLRAYEQKVNNIEIENRLASNLPEIMIDHFQMQQVFLNIIVNAEFAMMESHHRGKLTITTKKSDSFIKIAITDDGPGIAKENLKHIFDPFFTTKEVGKGTGLGLSICHGIVTEHGGQIYARSEKGQGATFVVELPLINEQ
jgi:PAS domain S-box-containing protein